jgi:hypothetical protein
MTLNRELEFDHIHYSTEIDSLAQTINFSVENTKKKSIPEYLYKYYGINDFSVSALINNFFFAPHPMLLNDKYDCCAELIDYSNLDIEFYIRRLSKEYNFFTENEIRELYNSNDKKLVLSHRVADLNMTVLFRKFGLISLTEEPSNPLMWAHYSQNSGFAVKVKTSLLPRSFFGPFPINYSDIFESIDFSKNENALCFLYQSNIKNKIWSYENEWRYLTYNENGNYHPIYSSIDINSRKFPYNTDAVEGIILGYEFFNPREFDNSNRTKEFDIIHLSNNKCKKVHKLKRKILCYITKNSIPCLQIVRNRYSFELKPVEIKIEQLSTNKFKVYNSFKQIY